MVAQSENSTTSPLKIIKDTLLVSLGIILGGLIGLVSLWLWFDYRFDPSHSTLLWLSGQFAAAMPAPLTTFLSEQARLMGLPLAGETSAYWYMARAGGVVAYLLMWLSVVWGLALSTKVVNQWIAAPLAYGLHEFLSLATLVFATLHSLVLLGDSYINFSLLNLAVPFTAPYQPFWTGLGTLGFYLSLALTGSFYIRQQIGQKVWRSLHYFTFLAFILALGHGLMAGTDSQSVAIQAMYAGTALSVLFLTFYRLLTLKGNKAKTERG